MTQQKRVAMGIQARAHVRKIYSIESAVDRELNILERLSCRF